jgi:DNA topoisomerase-6 subunit B
VSRKLKKYLQKRDAFQKQKLKQDALSYIIPKIAEKVAKITEREMPPIELVLARIIGKVAIARTRKEDEIELIINNYTGENLELEITEIVSRIPTEISEGSVVNIGNEWFIKWLPNIKKNESKKLSYMVEDGAKFDIEIKGIEKEKMVLEI